jgi:hypothetical protein
MIVDVRGGTMSITAEDLSSELLSSWKTFVETQKNTVVNEVVLLATDGLNRSQYQSCVTACKCAGFKIMLTLIEDSVQQKRLFRSYSQTTESRNIIVLTLSPTSLRSEVLIK